MMSLAHGLSVLDATPTDWCLCTVFEVARSFRSCSSASSYRGTGPLAVSLTLRCPLQDTGLYYDRYLREVIEVLETDPHFREKLQTANTEDIKVSVGPWLGSAPTSSRPLKVCRPPSPSRTGA